MFQESWSGSHEDVAVANLNFKRGNRLDRWHTEWSASTQIELRAVTRTSDRTIFDGAIRQRLTIVRTNILDRKIFISHTDQQGRKIVHKDRKATPGRDLTCGSDSFKF